MTNELWGGMTPEQFAIARANAGNIGTPAPTTGIGGGHGEKPTSQEILNRAFSSPSTEIIEWLISYTLAYFLIRNAGTIKNDIVSSAKALLGLTVI